MMISPACVRWTLLGFWGLSPVANGAAIGLYGLGTTHQDLDRASIFSLNRTTGQGTFVVNLSQGAGANSLEYIPKLGKALGYQATSNKVLYSIEIDTGSVSAIGSSGTQYSIGGLAYDSSSDVLYGIDYAGNMYRVDMFTGHASLFGDAGPIFGWAALAFDTSTRTLFGTNVVDDALYRIDVTTGVGTFVGATGFNGIDGLAYDFLNDVLYGTNVSIGVKKLVRIDRATGAGTIIGDLSIGATQGIYGLTFVPESSVLSFIALTMTISLALRRQA